MTALFRNIAASCRNNVENQRLIRDPAPVPSGAPAAQFRFSSIKKAPLACLSFPLFGFLPTIRPAVAGPLPPPRRFWKEGTSRFLPKTLVDGRAPAI